MLPFFFDDYGFRQFHDKQIIHDTITDNVVKLINELPETNIHEKFYIFCYLLWGGYLSINKMYVYNNIPPEDEHNTIFLGKGCCRHNANLLNEVYRKLGISSEDIAIKLIKNRSKNVIELETKVESCTVSKNNEKILYNHKICVAATAEENSTVFLFDPTMLTECEILKNCKLVCFDGLYKIDRRIFRTDLCDNWTFNYNLNRRGSLTIKELKNFYESAKDICITNKLLFDDFYTDNYQNYEKIKKLNCIK